MGDRVSVTLTIPSHHYDAARQIIEQYDGDGYDVTKGEVTSAFEFDEVNYAELVCEDYLTKAGIAWEKDWGAGGGFTAGTAWAMFNENGDLHCIEIAKEDPRATLEPFFTLLDNPTALAGAMANIQKSLTILPWENQVEYGKRYLAATLINPPQTDSAPT